MMFFLKLKLSSSSLVVITAWTARFISALSMIYSLRILVVSLTANQYSMFILLVGIIGWFSLSDGGLGYAIQNIVTKKLTMGEGSDQEIIWAYTLQVFFCIVVITTLYIFREEGASFLFSKIDPGELSAGYIFIQSVIIFVLAAAVSLPTKILYGLHRGYIANIAASLAAVLGVLGLMLGIDSVKDKITFSIFALYGPSVLLGVGFSICQIYKALKSRPSFQLKTAWELIQSAKGFFLFYFMASAALQIDYLVISQRISDSKQIITYFSLAKVFNLLAFFTQAILLAAWPKLNSFHSTGSVKEIREMLYRLVVFSGLVTMLAIIAVLLGRNLLSGIIAPGTSIIFSPLIIIGFGAIALIRCFADPYAIFLQSIGQTKVLIICAGVQAFFGFGLQWYFSGLFGVEGILLGIALAFSITAAWVLPYYTKKLLNY